MSLRVYIGYDPRQRTAWQVCAASLQARTAWPVPVAAIGRQELEAAGLYTRPHSERDGVQWDDISGAPCSTDFSLARFWVPMLAGLEGWALYCDCDFLWRRDVRELLGLADPRYAVMVVKHAHVSLDTVKMDGQPQTNYARKNWSSLVMWNLEHSGVRALTSHALNVARGLDLHQFSWLDDSEIGALPVAWNWLCGHSPSSLDAAAAHFTRGTPDMRGHENTLYAVEWWKYAQAFTERKAA